MYFDCQAVYSFVKWNCRSVMLMFCWCATWFFNGGAHKYSRCLYPAVRAEPVSLQATTIKLRVFSETPSFFEKLWIPCPLQNHDLLNPQLARLQVWPKPAVFRKSKDSNSELGLHIPPLYPSGWSSARIPSVEVAAFLGRMLSSAQSACASTPINFCRRNAYRHFFTIFKQ